MVLNDFIWNTLNVGYYGDWGNSGITSLYFKQTHSILEPEAQERFINSSELQFSCLMPNMYLGNYDLLKVNDALR